jgi:hypothetical protein
MSTFQFNPVNPFNIRGVSVSPSNPTDGSDAPFTAKNDVYYYVVFIDTVANSGVDASGFTISNPSETGDKLSYAYAGSLVVPTQDNYTTPGGIQTIGFPLYTNQKIDKPNKDQNNLTAVLTVVGNSNTAYKGDPQLRKPPVFDKVYSAPPLTCFPFVIGSATDPNANYLVVLANTGVGNMHSQNSGAITSYGVGTNEYGLTFQFNGTQQNEVGHAVVCIGMIGNSDLTVYKSINACDMLGQYRGQIQPLNFTDGSIPVHTPPM